MKTVGGSKAAPPGRAFAAVMYFIPTGIFLKSWAALPLLDGVNTSALTWPMFLWKNLLPVTIGNIIGGAVFVGISYCGAYLSPARANRKTA